MPDEAVDPGQGFVRLKESLGSLLLCWSRLEDAVADALRRVRTLPPGKAASFGDRVTALTRELDAAARAGLPCTPDGPDLVRRIDEARRVRNLIVHRLTGVCADPNKGEPHIICDAGPGKQRTQVRITQAELSDLLSSIDRCTRDLALVDGRSR